MLGDKKIIGLCTTKIQNRMRAHFVDEVNRAVLSAGCKLVCFNSFDDFCRDDVYSRGARTIFDRMDFKVLDGLILCEEHFCDETILAEIIKKAQQNDIPILVTNGEWEGCLSAKYDFTEAFRELVTHLIEKHGVTDFFFMAGRRERDLNSVEKYQCFRSVLADHEIPFDSTKIRYGDYLEGTAMAITQELINSSGLPEAIVCANDSMAFGVCRKLEENGIRVPLDVIVTGFGGIPSVKFHHPILTTCQQNRGLLAREAVEMLLCKIEGRECDGKVLIPYEFTIAESCGCQETSQQLSNLDAIKLYAILEEAEAFEEAVNYEINQMMNIVYIKELFEPLSRFILPSSWMCLGSRFMKQASETGWESDKSVAISSAGPDGKKIRYFGDEEMLPETEEWLQNDNYYILTALQAKDQNCGFYAVSTDNAVEIGHKIKKTSGLANVVSNILLNLFRQRNMMQDLENAAFQDNLTGLANLKGATRWFDEFAQIPANHQSTLTITVHNISGYTDIYENHGLHEVEEILCAIADRIRRVSARDSFLAKISESEFLVITRFKDHSEAVVSGAKAVADLDHELEMFNQNSGKGYRVEISSGSTIADSGWSGTLGAFIKYAANEMVLSKLKVEEKEPAEQSIQNADYFSVFKLLVDNNLFTYHFQPILNAKTGAIYGYEALMRTIGGITLTPKEVLEAADKCNCLGRIEYATIFNVLKRFSEDFEQFKGRKVFINTIPNHFLSDEDREEVLEKYGPYLEHIVIEVTEQDSSSDEELDSIKRFCSERAGIPIAIDDYGTGHSNIVNLLRYSPQIIKIDRYLIQGVEKDSNKQMFIKNTLEFAAMNGIKVLAEGVETSDELKTVIEYGVDLIQGFYTARPAPMPVAEIRENVRNEIIETNLRLMRFSTDGQKVYTASDGETINLVDLALENYNFVSIVGGNVKLIGKKDSRINISIKIADNAQTKLTFEEVNLNGRDQAVVQLGMNSNAELLLIGYNTFHKNGIFVPKNAHLRITGNGSLQINANSPFSVGIGSRHNEPYGEIILENRGRIKVISSGDQIIGVGGGTSNSPIQIKCGHLEVAGSGISVLGIGSTSGEAFIQIGEAEVLVKESGNEAIGIGTVNGKFRIISEGDLNVTADGERAVPIGTMGAEGSSIELKKGVISTVCHCDCGASLGTIDGGVSICLDECELNVYGEGSTVTGIGSNSGNAVTEINGGIIDVKVLSAFAKPFGDEEDKLIITGGNVICRNDEVPITAWNAYGQKLHLEIKNDPVFEKMISTDRGEYLYQAKQGKQDKICVYLP